MRALMVVLALMAGAVAADQPNPQLLRQIETKLRFYDVQVDTSQLTVSQAAQLHLLLTANSDKLGYVRTRSRIAAILRNG